MEAGGETLNLNPQTLNPDPSGPAFLEVEAGEETLNLNPLNPQTLNP